MTDPRRLIDEGADEFERDLLRAGRRDQISTRSKAAILASLGVAAPLPFAINDPTQAAAATSAGTKALMAKVAAGTLGMFGLATGVYLTQSSTALAPPAPRSSPAIVIQASPAKAEPPMEDEAVGNDAVENEVADPGAADPSADRALEVEPEARTASRAPSEAKGVRQPDSIARELAQIEVARSALRAGEPNRSLKLIAEYLRDYPKGNLRTEATVLRIEALSAAGDDAAAAKLGKQFLAQSPNGPYARRIRSLLGQTETNR